MSEKNVLVDQTPVDHSPLETQTTEKEVNKFEAFKSETRRIRRAYWASVKRAEAQSREIRDSYTPVYQCPVCGFLRPANHSKDCKDLRPVDISMQEKLNRMDDPMNDRTWDYNWDEKMEEKRIE